MKLTTLHPLAYALAFACVTQASAQPKPEIALFRDLPPESYYLVLHTEQREPTDGSKGWAVALKGPYKSENEAKAYLNPEHPELVTSELKIATGASLADMGPMLVAEIYLPTPAIVAVPTGKNPRLYAYKGVTDLKSCENDIASLIQAFAVPKGLKKDRQIVWVYGTLPGNEGTGEPINRNPRKEPCSFFFNAYGTDGEDRKLPLVPGSNYGSYWIFATDNLAVYEAGKTDVPLTLENQKVMVQFIKNRLGEGFYVILPWCYSHVWAEKMGL